MVYASSPAVSDFVAHSRIRRTLLEILSKGPKTPTELALIEKKHVSHVSRALAELRGQGLIEAIYSNSRERYYRATPQGMAIYYHIISMPK